MLYVRIFSFILLHLGKIQITKVVTVAWSFYSGTWIHIQLGGSVSVSNVYLKLDSINYILQAQVPKAFLKAYVPEGPASMQGPLDDKTKSPIREAVLLTAKASVNAVKALNQTLPQEENFWQDAVINRILRGVLWTINNGNAPGRDTFAEPQHRGEDRSLECSLSYKELERLERSPETVYIS